MSIIRYVRSRLALKLLLSYVIIIIVGVAVLATAAELATPRAFEHHLAEMSQMMGNSSMAMEMNFFNNFRAAVNEALTLATVAALVVAIAVSVFVSRRIVTPVRAMMTASQHIAEGHYHERVEVPALASWGDLDELERLAVSFNRMAAQLEQIEATRRELIGNVAHELRTPLTTIKGSMEGLIDEVLPADIQTFQQIYREADRLERLAQDLQELSRVESAAFELQLMPVSVVELVSTTVDQLAPQFQEKEVNLKTEIPPDLPKVRADGDRIRQVLLNLIGNALQYTSPGGGVRVIACRRDAEVHIMVTDTGIGIAPEYLSLIFTRFYRIDKSRSRIGGGSGIGLTIVKHLVEAHGGRVWAKSDGLHQGSTFGFSLPLA